MKKNTSESNGKLSVHSLVSNSRTPEVNIIKQKGRLYSDAVMLLLKKSGVTDKEIKEMIVQSVRHNESMAKQFQEDIKENPLPIDELISEIMFRPHTNINIPVFYDLPSPFPSGSIRIEPDNAYKHFSLHVEGTGSGLLKGTMTQTVYNDPFVFKFTAMDRGDYRITAPLITIGPYFIIADAGPCNDKFATLTVSTYATVNKIKDNKVIDGLGYWGGSLAGGRIEDAAIRSEILVGHTVAPVYTKNQQSNFIPIEKGDQIEIKIGHQIYAQCCGGGSIAEANFEKGTGAIYCPYLDIGWIGRP